MHTYLSKLDYSIFKFFNSWAGHPASDWFFIFFAVYIVYILPALLLVWWFVAKDRLVTRKAIIMATFSALLAREVLKPVIVHIWTRNRPFIEHTVHNIISKTDNEPSFPSGHALAMFAIAAAVYHYNKKAGMLLYVTAILTGISRVVVGVHYPSDIIGGAVLGIIVGWLTVKLLDTPLDRFVKKCSEISDKLFPFTKVK